MYDLSVIIPSRNEEFLTNTINDVLLHSEGRTEVIVVLDGQWAVTPIKQDPRVTVVYHPKSIGQRAACNDAVKLSSAKYIMKLDAHCSLDRGFDVKLMADMQDDWTVAPTMRNLWAFDWKCYSCGWKKYQGPTPEKCPNCGRTDRIRKKMMWVAKNNPQANSYCFDSTPHFQYFKDYNKRPEGQGDLTESMSLQGSCFMLTRDKYWELGICDEEFGSWGSQGLEVATKTWLSGGRVIINHKTYYAHLFRTQGGDFSFPYPNPESKVQYAKKHAKDIFFNNAWDKQVHTLKWLVDKFSPVPGWDEEALKALK